MNLFILCIAMILANNWAVADPCNCGTQNCGTQNCGTQNCGTQNCGTQNNCNTGLCDSGAGLLDDDRKTSFAFNQYGISSDEFLCEPPREYMGVEFDVARANLGNCISPFLTILPARYFYKNANPKYNYTVVVVVKGVPSPATPLLDLFLVSLVINVGGSELLVGASQITSGDEIAPWVGPFPAQGAGPYLALAFVYEQNRYIDPDSRTLAQVSAIRINFDLERFRSNFTLNLVAGNFWSTCLPDDYCNVCDQNKPYRRYRNDGHYAFLNNDNIGQYGTV